MKPTYHCPKGHVATLQDNCTPACIPCKLIATHYNGKSGEVHEWTPMAQYRANCERLQEEMDAAFDNQYFDGGW